MLCLYWFPHEAQLRWNIELFSLSLQRLPSLWLSVSLHPEGRLVSTALKERTLIAGSVMSGCSVLASVRHRHPQAWTLDLFFRPDAARSVQVWAEQPWRAHQHWWAEIKWGDTRYWLIHTVKRFGFGAAAVRYHRHVKDEEWGESRRRCLPLISTWSCCILRVHEARPARLKIA